MTDTVLLDENRNHRIREWRKETKRGNNAALNIWSVENWDERKVGKQSLYY